MKNLPLNLNRQSLESLYQQVVHAVREQIRAGSLVQGDQLPTLQTLSRSLGVNRLTIGRAYQELAAQGLIVQHRGLGTFVAESAAERLGAPKLRSLERIAFVSSGFPGKPVALMYRFIFADILAGVHCAASRLNANVSVFWTGDGLKNQELLDGVCDRLGAFDGILFLCEVQATCYLLDRIGDRLAPAIQLFYELNHPRVATVRYDKQEAIRQAIGMLGDAGHRRVGYVGLDDRNKPASKFGFFVEDVSRRGMSFDPQDVVWVSEHFNEAHRGVTRQLAERWRDNLPDALFVDTDFKAFETIHALEAAGLHVPRDIAIVGYDDIDEAAKFTPAISTVHTPRVEMGRAAVECLSGWLEGMPTPQPILLAPRAVVRQTHTASVPADHPHHFSKENIG